VHVGDRMIVHFTNKLPQPTTVHWHGMRVPIEMDGVPGISQPEVPPGGSFTYDFIVPDAGLFWYHPHVMSAMQVGFGLYGAVLVEDPAEDVGTASSERSNWCAAGRRLFREFCRIIAGEPDRVASVETLALRASLYSAPRPLGRNYTWAEMMKRVFELDVLECSTNPSRWRRKSLRLQQRLLTLYFPKPCSTATVSKRRIG